MPGDRGYTSLMIDQTFWKKVKMAALERDMTVSEFVEKGLSEYIASVSSPSAPMVEKASSILSRLQNREFAVTGGLDVVTFPKKGVRKKEEPLATSLSSAMTAFERAVNMEKTPSTAYLPEEMAKHLLAVFNQGIASNAITEGPGLMSKIEQLTKESERLLSDNTRLLKENEQLRSTLQNVSTAYEDFSAKNR